MLALAGEATVVSGESCSGRPIDPTDPVEDVHLLVRASLSPILGEVNSLVLEEVSQRRKETYRVVSLFGEDFKGLSFVLVRFFLSSFLMVLLSPLRFVLSSGTLVLSSFLLSSFSPGFSALLSLFVSLLSLSPLLKFLLSSSQLLLALSKGPSTASSFLS